jgi:cytochrome P450/NADPH-cytochrome P450 reductase
MPAFGPSATRGMYADMMDICSQLILKWARFGPNHAIDPADDFTRLAFDTIALCAMSYRLNSFYQKETPDFIRAMGDFLVESLMRSRRLRVVQSVMSKTNAQYQADIKLMNELAEKSKFGTHLYFAHTVSDISCPAP